MSIDISKHPLIKQAHEVCQAIEKCGASTELTGAVTKASELMQGIANLTGRVDELESADNRINRLESIVAVAEKRNALMREWKRALKVPCDLVDDQVPVVIHGMVVRLDRLKETEEKLAAAEKRIAELEAREVQLPKPHAYLIWIQAGYAPDDYWDDVSVSHSEKDKCCDGSDRYPVYARWEIEEVLAAAGITVKGE